MTKKLLVVEVPDGMLIDPSIMAYDEKDLAYCLGCKEITLPSEDELVRIIKSTAKVSIGKDNTVSIEVIYKNIASEISKILNQ